MAEQIVTLNPGESKVVSFEAIPNAAKVYQVSVEGLTGSFKAVTAPVADIRLSNLEITPAECHPGTNVTISCTATNHGSVAGSKTIVLNVATAKVDERTVTLQPSESKGVSFTIVPIDVKTYSVSVDGLSGTLKVTVPPTPIDYSTVRTIAGTLTLVGFDFMKGMGQLLIATDMAIDSSGKDWGGILGTIELFSNYPFAFEAGPGYAIPVPLIQAGRRVLITGVARTPFTTPSGEVIDIWTAGSVKYYPDYPASAYFFMLSKSGRYWTVSGNVSTFSAIAVIYEGTYHHSSYDQKVLGPISNWYCPYVPGLVTECWCHPNPNATWQYQYKKQAEIDNWQFVGSTV